MTKPYIAAFVDAISPGFGALLLASHNERTLLTAATETIVDLRKELEAARAVVEAARMLLEPPEDERILTKLEINLGHTITAYDAAMEEKP